MDFDKELAARLDKLERENRILKRSVLVVAAGLCCFSLAAWRAPQDTVSDTLKVHRLEVVDSRGVPMVALGLTRNDAGGSIVLRDSSGDKRSWWETENGQSRIVFESPVANSEQRSVAGLSTAPGRAQLSLLGPLGASVQSAVQQDRPTLTLQDSNGKQLFAAPWSR